jgi:putative flippase GtrA
MNARHCLSATAAYFIGVAYHFVMNRKFTFRDPQGHLLKQLTKYAFLVAANYLTTLVLFGILLRSMRLLPLVTFALSVALTTATGYLVMRFWIFPGSIRNESKQP